MTNQCPCCDTDIISLERIKENLNWELELALENLKTLDDHTQFHEEGDSLKIEYLLQLAEEFKERINKIKLKGTIYLLTFNGNTKQKEYIGLTLFYKDYHFVISFEKNKANVTFHPNIETETVTGTGTFCITKKNINSLLDYNSAFWTRAEKLYDSNPFPIGDYFHDLKRFLRIALDLEFSNYPDFYKKLMKKIDQKEDS